MLKNTKNALLVKDDVGHAKPSVRDLPPEGFAYGKCEEHDPEGVSQSKVLPNSLVTRSWDYGNHSRDAVPEKDFKKLNALCIRRKALNAKVNSRSRIGRRESKERRRTKNEGTKRKERSNNGIA